MTTLNLEFKIRGGVDEAWRATDPEILVEGPRGTGKSRGLLEKENAYAVKYPGIRILFVRKRQNSIAGSIAQTFRQQVLHNGDGVSYFGGNSIEPESFRYKNGSAIVMAGLDDPEKLKSSEYSRIYVNEATELAEDDWDDLKALLRQNLPGVSLKRQITGDCNPGDSGHWLNLRCEAGTIRRIKTRLTDNPFFYNEDGTPTEEGVKYVEGILATYQGARRKRWLEGEWTGVENAAYPNFDRAIHIRPLPAGIYFKRTLLWNDYGSVHKASIGAMSIDQFNRRWIRECWGAPDTDGGKTLDLIMGQFKERYATTIGRGDPNQKYFNGKAFSNEPDDSGRRGHTARGGNGMRQVRIDWAEPLFGIFPGGRVPSMSDAARLKMPQGPFAEPDSPGIFLVEGAPGIEEFAREVESYHYVIKDTERGKVKEIYRMEDDHLAGFEYVNELWEEMLGSVSFPQSVPSPAAVGRPEPGSKFSRLNKRTAVREWKMH